jgi:hypothetical protein
MINKKMGLNKHSKKRAIERFHVKLNRNGLYNIVTDIRNGHSQFKKKVTNRVTAWIVRIPGANEDAIALYDKHRKAVITFMPLDYEI